MAEPNTDPLHHDGPARTDVDCHDCGKVFIALLDYDIDGNHIIECPNCGHEHCRVIQKGKITGDRWSSRYGNDKSKDGIKARRTWKHSVLPASATSITQYLLRERWINRES